MPTLIEMIPISIAILSLIMAYLGFKDKRTDKASKEYDDRVKALALSTAASEKAIALADAVNEKAATLAIAVNEKAATLSIGVNARIIEIKEIQEEVYKLETKIGIINERVNGLVKISDGLIKKLDNIS